MTEEVPSQAPSQVFAPLPTRKEVPMVWHLIETYKVPERMDMERTLPCN